MDEFHQPRSRRGGLCVLLPSLEERQAGGFQVEVDHQDPASTSGQDSGCIDERHRPAHAPLERIEGDELCFA